MTGSEGVTVWLTGLPSAGKSAIAEAVADRLRAAGRRVEILDGDDMRRFLSAGLGFSKEDRDTNVRRIGFVAELLASHGVTVLVPVIAPYACSRAAVREHHAAADTAYLEAYVATPVWVCAERDVKGLYSAQAEGRLTALTGIDDPYEIPVEPDMSIPAHEQTVAESAQMLFAVLVERGLA